MSRYLSIKMITVILLIVCLFINLTGCREGSGSSSLGLIVGPSQPAISAEGFALEGHITNGDPNQALGNVPVVLYNSMGQKIATTNTTVEGKFYFFGVPADFYQVKIDEKGTILSPLSYYMRVLPDGKTSPEAIEIPTSSVTGSGEVVTFPISGVLRDRNDTEKPAAFVLVELYSGDKLLQVQQATSTGGFYFSGLASGSYRFILAKGSDQYMIRDDVVFAMQSGGVIVPPVSMILLEPKVGDTGGKQISGQLVNENNSLSVGNIRVVLRRDGIALGETFTTAEGRFFFFDRTPDFYELQVFPTTYFASATSYIRMLPDGTTSPADIKIQLVLAKDNSAVIPTFPISGNLKNARKPDESVAYLLVELFKNNILTQIQQTNAVGDFNFLGLATGTYKLSFGRGSAVFIEKDDVIFDMLPNGIAAPPVNLVFIEPKEIASASYQISGLVKAARSNQPLANITVSLTREGTTLTETSTTTAEGKFFFFDRSEGFYTIRVPGNASYTETESFIRILPDGTVSPTVLEIIMQEVVDPDESKRTYMVVGNIKDRSKPDQAVTYTLVELLEGNSLKKVQQTDANGGFLFEGLFPGQYRLALARGSDLFEFRDDVVFDILTTGVITPPVNLLFLTPKEIDKKYTVSGLVMLGTTNEPLTGMKVELWKDAIAGTPLKTTFTTGEGRFTFGNLETGLYFTRVGADQSTYRPRSDYIIQISEDGVISPKEPLIKMTKDLTTVQTYLDLEGIIRDAFTGAPLEYVTVNLKGYGNVLTDREGYYYFKDIPVGLYNLEMQKPGFNTLSVSVQIVKNETNNTLMTLPGNLDYYMIYNQETAKGSIAGRAVNPDDGTPLPDKIVRVYRMAELTKKKNILSPTGTMLEISETRWETSNELLVSTRTGSGSAGYDDAGTFKITHLDPGYYLVYIGENNSKPVFKTVTYLYPADISWTIEDHVLNVDRIHSWSVVNVSAGITTYLTTYDTEKR
ncbi:MAG TPA: carboxypeptidase regulatory-like domain-containing protein [Candidatus Rifleibacterium sp.]|nr:carboxypeptidase regulatory-like domain-containing protein [Candidatus Rifleibacterium sp.]HPT45527.1 carboxypeptidase regulatory-like domain-containing protein [Candidatus Rifleibacterium sp.]